MCKYDDTRIRCSLPHAFQSIVCIYLFSVVILYLLLIQAMLSLLILLMYSFPFFSCVFLYNILRVHQSPHNNGIILCRCHTTAVPRSQHLLQSLLQSLTEDLNEARNQNGGTSSNMQNALSADATFKKATHFLSRKECSKNSFNLELQNLRSTYCSRMSVKTMNLFDDLRVLQVDHSAPQGWFQQIVMAVIDHRMSDGAPGIDLPQVVVNGEDSDDNLSVLQVTQKMHELVVILTETLETPQMLRLVSSQQNYDYNLTVRCLAGEKERCSWDELKKQYAGDGSQHGVTKQRYQGGFYYSMIVALMNGDDFQESGYQLFLDMCLPCVELCSLLSVQASNLRTTSPSDWKISWFDQMVVVIRNYVNQKFLATEYFQTIHHSSVLGVDK